MSENKNNELPIVLYTTPDGGVKVNAVLKDESLWLSQTAMVGIFEVDKSTISRHIKNIFAEGELDEKVVVAKIATTTRHGAMSDKTQEHRVVARCRKDKSSTCRRNCDVAVNRVS